MHESRKYTSSQEGINKGNLVNKAFKKHMMDMVKTKPFEYNEKHPDTYFPDYADKHTLTNPDFITKDFWIECKYSAKGLIYESNLTQLQSYIDAYDDAWGYLVVVTSTLPYSYSIYNARSLLRARQINWEYSPTPYNNQSYDEGFFVLRDCYKLWGGLDGLFEKEWERHLEMEERKIWGYTGRIFYQPLTEQLFKSISRWVKLINHINIA